MKESEKDSLVRSVYNVIENRKGKVTAKHLEKEVGSIYKVRYALTHLVRERKIRRTRAFGINRIDYFYDVYNNEK
jgi:hypothetical protein